MTTPSSIPRPFFAAFFSLLLIATGASAQSDALPSTIVESQNLSDFRPTGGNWSVVGDVFYDLNKAGAGISKPGTGVLVNNPYGKVKDNLLTRMEHGDMDLDLDFMLEKGGNSGVYLQGRYEVQLFDSWGVTVPKSGDCGAIYDRWDNTRPDGRKGYEGHPPMQNVCKAPGLWQHLSISFRAPRFNAAGQKTANARFLNVILNGVLVQENVELTGPTRGGMATEKPTGPLLVQGDHGAVALRNIRYKAYDPDPVTLTNMSLSAYEGRFKSVEELAALTPTRTMPLDVLAHLAPGKRDNFGGRITGTLHIPRAGQYLLSLNLRWIPGDTDPNGAGELTIGGKTVLRISDRQGGTVSTMVSLDAGDLPLVLRYYKNFGFWYARSNDILISLEGPGVPQTTLNPVIRAEDPVGEIALLARSEPVMQRGFVNHRGTKHTHTISVGEPGNANYTVDLQRGEFLQFWRGDFLETTPMWAGRGETQLSVPMGSVIELPGKPSLAYLADQASAWPDSNATYVNQGYDIDKAGRPVFKYTLGGAGVRESFATADTGRKLTHSFAVTGSEAGAAGAGLWCRVAEGREIAALPNGLYAIDDKQYLIELPGDAKPLIRSTARNTKEMLLPVKPGNGGTLTYSLIW
jgi:Domain of Unknown Function (DUF1080)